MKRTLYLLNGTLTAMSNITVTRDGDKFTSSRTKEGSRIPRNAVQRDDAPGYFPSSSIMGRLRRATDELIREKLALSSGNEKPYQIGGIYLNRQGMVLGKAGRDQLDTAKVSPELQAQYRDINPGVSIHGRWGLQGLWGMGPAYPREEDAIVWVGNKYRSNEFVRTPELVSHLSEESTEQLEKIFRHEERMKTGKAPLEEEKKILQKKRRMEDDKEIRGQISDRIQALDEEIKAIKKNDSDETFDEVILRPVEGYEAIRRGSVMDNRMIIDSASELEIGLVLATLRHFAKAPLVGGHRRDGCGEIAGEYTVTIWPEGAPSLITLGVVYFGFFEFGFREGSEKLEQLLANFDEVAKDFSAHGIDFTLVGMNGYKSPKVA